jgi:methionyl-tRNA formyltransferase
MPTKLLAETKRLEESQAEAAVLVAYGKIIPQSIIDIFPKGIINIHPSLLPKYRGPTPVETAILGGVKQTGVSLMQLTAEMDAGPIFAQAKVQLTGTETKQVLADKLLKSGRELLAKHLPAILDGKLRPKAQDDVGASYTKLFTKEDGVMDWNRPAEALERQVRAFASWPKSVTRVFGHKIIVTKARAANDEKDGELVMRCHPGWLAIEELIAPSGRSMSAVEFIRGYRKN